MSGKYFVVTAEVSATANPVSVDVTFDKANTYVAGFKQIVQGFSIDGFWTWVGLPQGSSAFIALTGPGVSAQVAFSGGGMDATVTFTLQGVSGPLATHTTPANVTSDSFTFDVAGAGMPDTDVAVALQQFINPSPT